MSKPLALVTGATRGIGLEIAKSLAPTHRVLIGGRDATRAAEIAAALPDAIPFVVDLTNDAALAEAVATIDELDVLVHSAGMLAYGPLADAPTQEWRDVLDVNVVAPATLTRLLLPALRRAQGLVIFINSGAGQVAKGGFSVYAASKHALTGMADALRAEERGKIRVTSIHPGPVATDMQEALANLAGVPYQASDHLAAADVAKLVRLAVDLPEASLNNVRITAAGY